MDDTELMALSNDDGVSVHAGFPNPAAERRQAGLNFGLDLNRQLIKHPASSFVFRVSGHHWNEEGIYDGDIAIVDRALTPRPIDRVLTWEDGGFRIYRHRQMAPSSESWGVITSIIHQFRFAGSPGRDR